MADKMNCVIPCLNIKGNCNKIQSTQNIFIQIIYKF